MKPIIEVGWSGQDASVLVVCPVKGQGCRPGLMFGCSGGGGGPAMDCEPSVWDPNSAPDQEI